VLDMARALTDAVAPDREPVVTGEWRPGDVRHVFAATTAAAEQLGFRPVEDFGAGMRELAATPLRAAWPSGAGTFRHERDQQAGYR
jgi:dTDP-L-rhamnose 4-epimerase